MPSIGVYGPSGHGKSTAIRPPDGIGLNPANTFIICPDLKALPFRGSKVLFPEVHDSNGKIDLKNSRFYTQDKVQKADKSFAVRSATSPKTVLTLMQLLEADPTIENGVIDTLNHIMTDFMLKRSQEKGYDKFTELGDAVYAILNYARHSRINWFILMHNEEEYDLSGTMRSKIKTQGKLLDRHVDIPSMFTIMLTPHVAKDELTGRVQFAFRTYTEGNDVAKSPHGMFEPIIPNDFGLVLERMHAYEQGLD